MPPSPSKLKHRQTPTKLLQRRLVLGVFLLLTLLLALPVLRRLRNGICPGSFLLVAIGVCPAITASQWDLFYHLGGNGPWIPKVDTIEYSDAPLPKYCSVDQVHMLSRHAERYPTKNAGARHFDLLERLHRPDITLTGSLSFLKTWNYFTDPSDPAFENLTTTGPYSGTLQASNTGKLLRQRYNNLVHKTRRTKFWSCSSPRDVQTARYFADGFFGSSWTVDGSAELEVIPEDEDRGADTLTPGDTCLKYLTDGEYGHNYGYKKLDEWQRVFTKPIATRLARDAAGMQFSPLDVYGMMEMCGFEILARGTSSWCDLFTQEEWLEFEYARDLLHFHRAGPGNSYAGAMGWLWLNATQDLMADDTSNDIFFSFVHDGDIVPVMATLQLLNERQVLQELPTDHMKTSRHWRTSDVVPMGGRLIFERISCGTDSTHSKEHLVRLFINDGLMKLPGLPSVQDVEHAVLFTDFQDFIASRGNVFGEFREVCSLPEDAADRITFLHQ